jgi:hypothetical protein
MEGDESDSRGFDATGIVRTGIQLSMIGQSLASCLKLIISPQRGGSKQAPLSSNDRTIRRAVP